MFMLKNPLLLLLLSSGAESKLGKSEQAGTGTEIKVRELQQDPDEWFEWSNFTQEERYIVKTDSTLNAEMINPNTVGRFADGVDTHSVDWDVVVVNNELEISEIAETHTILERDHLRIPISIETEDISKKEQRRLDDEVPWGINNIFDEELPDWDAVMGTNRTADAIKVCIIDSGYYEEHEDLPEGFDATAGYGGAWNEDGCTHGSHVAGTMLAKKNSVGVVGVFPGQNPFIVKVFGDDDNSVCGWSWSSTLVLAMQKCNETGAKVINMSLGGSSWSSNEQIAIDELYEYGVLLVAAAGNGASDAYSYPASYDNVVSVAAVDVNNVVASFSQHNDQVDIAGPGVGIRSTDGTSNDITSKSGTSMASPHVAALASLLWNQFPECTNTQIITAIQEGALDAGDVGPDNYYGHGIAKYHPSRDLLVAGWCITLPTTSPVPTKSPTTLEPTTSPAPTDRSQSFELNVKTDSYPAETSWTLTLGGVEVADGGNYNIPNADQTPFTKELVEGFYELTFADQYGDGMCCTYGQGRYEAKLEGDVVASGGEFDQDETTDITVEFAAQPTSTLPIGNPVSFPTTSSPVSVQPTTSSQPKFWAVCPKRGECDTDDTVSETWKYHAVRCCSNNPILGWKKNNGCDVWGRSLLDKTCALDETYSFALNVCTEAGARLCTKEELVGECTMDTECEADNTLVWSSSSAIQGPTESPTSQTSGISYSPAIQAPSTLPISNPISLPTTSSPVSAESKFWAVCPKSGECDSDDTVSETWKYHALRCCSNTLILGWKKNNGCDVWGRSLLDKTCALDEDYFFALNVCTQAGARLCTKEELVGECTMDTECGADNKRVWSSSSAIQGPTESPTSQTSGISSPQPTPTPSTLPTDEPTAEPTTAVPTAEPTTAVPTAEPTTAVPTAVPTVVPTGGPTGFCEVDTQGNLGKYWADCGRVGKCSENSDFFLLGKKHEVRCCSDTGKPGWKKHQGCSVWAASKMSNVCYGEKNFLEAECICNKHDARLCKKEELVDNCARGTGCGFDDDLVWTETNFDDSIASPTVSPVGTIEEQCASETQGDSTQLKYWADCGRDGRCGAQVIGEYDYDALHEVRCCSDDPIVGWNERCSGIWGESKFPGNKCYAGKNFFEAECLCGKYGGRLCTKQELEDDCTAGTGCGFDSKIVWTGSLVA